MTTLPEGAIMSKMELDGDEIEAVWVIPGLDDGIHPRVRFAPATPILRMIYELSPGDELPNILKTGEERWVQARLGERYDSEGIVIAAIWRRGRPPR